MLGIFLSAHTSYLLFNALKSKHVVYSEQHFASFHDILSRILVKVVVVCVSSPHNPSHRISSDASFVYKGHETYASSLNLLLINPAFPPSGSTRRQGLRPASHFVTYCLCLRSRDLDSQVLLQGYRCMDPGGSDQGRGSYSACRPVHVADDIL